MKTTFLLLLMLCCYLGMKAQTNFTPGYIITLENDTLHGLIDYRSEARNARKCEFKADENAPVQEFLPYSIKGYRFSESKYYVSHHVPVDGQQVPLFLEFLVNGISDLYFYSDGVKYRYFLETDQGMIYELTNDLKDSEEKERIYRKESKKFIGVLKYAFANCHQILPMVDKAQLEHESLIGLTRKYHDYMCNDYQCIVYEKKLPAVHFQWGMAASWSSSALSFTNNPYYESINFEQSVYPTVELLLNTSLPKANEKLSLLLAAEYSQPYFHGTGTDPQTNDFVEAHIRTSMLKGKVAVQYTWPKGKLRPMFIGGASYIKRFGTQARRIEEIITGSTVFISETKGVPMADIFVGLRAEAGLQYYSNSSLTPFIKLGYEANYGQSDFLRSQHAGIYLNTIQFHAGLYF